MRASHLTMRVCHVTPHLPPDQAANALLPFHLGTWFAETGEPPVYVSHPARSAGDRVEAATLPGEVTWIRRASRAPLARLTRAGSLAVAAAAIRRAGPAIEHADVVHLHSNGLLVELCGAIAWAKRRPTVLTLYGTEIWHYRATRVRPDLFTRAYRRARVVTFYSQGLLDRARQLGLDRPELRVVYPPVTSGFRRPTEAERAAARAELGVSPGPLLLNVKRLHPLAGQADLVAAMPAILGHHPEATLIICGTGTLEHDLRRQADALRIGDRVRLVGLVDNPLVARYQAAADLFVLPSLLEACPTVAVEALACGTPVVSTDNPGGVELGRLFGDDVHVVPRSRPDELARAIVERLQAPRRTREDTDAVLDREFRPGVVETRYREAYGAALRDGPGRGDGRGAVTS